MAGIKTIRKKYNNKLKSLAHLHGKNSIPSDAWLPPELKKDGLYLLDVDQDIWQDYNALDFTRMPKWLTDPDVREGIPLAQAILSCCSGKQWCLAEQKNLHQWISHEITAMHKLYTSSLSADVDVTSMALIKLMSSTNS